MRTQRAAGIVFGVLMGVSCGEQEFPTAPPAPGDPALSHIIGHKVVNSTADPGNGTCNAQECTLREAITDPGSTEISFAQGLSGPIALTRSLVIERSLAITGPAAGIVIQRPSTAGNFRVLRIGSGVAVKLTNLTLRDGRTDLPGGGIISFGTLTLVNCTVAGNISTQHGGGIDSHGPLTVTGTKIVNNSATGFGGGIHSHDQPLTMTSSTVARNVGGVAGGIAHRGDELRITNSAVSYNTGGGIYKDWGTATLDLVRILGNTGGGLRLSQATMTINNSTVANNSANDFAAGIVNGAGGSLTITGSTVATNSGTGILNQSFGDDVALVLTNSTVSGNSGDGLAIRQVTDEDFPATRLVNSTIARNTGYGIRRHTEGGAVLELVNTLVARNGPAGAPDMISTGTMPAERLSASHSLIGNGSGSGLGNDNGNQVGNVSPYSAPINPLLAPLANNGGPTKTHALETGSPAIDAASTPDCPATDQRGVLRPRGEACDIGSYER